MVEERRYGSALIELRNEPKPGGLPVISGYAAVFNSLSAMLTKPQSGTRFREVIRPGAFLRSLMSAAKGESDVIARFDHTGILGRTSNGTLRLKEDHVGLHFEFDAPDTQAGRDLVELIRRGDVRGSSFAFNAKRDHWRKEGGEQIRELHDVDLLDDSPVISPAYKATNARLWLSGSAGAMQAKLDLARVAI